MLLAALVLVCQDGIAETAWRLAKDPTANRDAILKLGPTAMRPLLDVRTAELEPLLGDLRLLGADDALVRDLRRPALAGKAGGVPAKGLLAYYGFVDRGIPDALANQIVDITFERGTRESHLQKICAKTGLEYRAIRGRIVLSTADRLWAWPAPGAVDPKILRQAALDLASGPVEARDAAAKTLLSAGEAALRFIESDDAESTAVMEKIRARIKPPALIETLAVERQELDDTGKALLKLLRESTAPIDFNGYELRDALAILFEKADVKWTLGKDVTAPVPAAEVRGLSTIDALWWLTVPWGNDVAIVDGKLVVDTRANVAKALKK